MSKITFITGGQRSGKSRFAQELANKKSTNPVYIATARSWDNDFEKRIKKHREDRGNQWINLEEEKQLSRLKLENKVVVLDCITLWLTNIFHDNQYDVEKSLHEAKNEWQEFIKQEFQLIIVSNELGMGVHGEHEVTRKFADLQGWINQYIAGQANEAYIMISGIPLKIKS